MNKGEIKNITDKYYGRLKKHMKTAAESFDAEAIHQFRVEYKKLRAFFRMLSQGEDTGGEIKILKKLKKAYNISGSIRDLQLQQQRITEAAKMEPKKPQAYLTLLEKEIDKLKPELLDIISENPVEQSKKKTDAAVPYEFSDLQFNLFIKKKQANITAIIASGHFGDDNIHAIRKDLKDLFYNLKSYGGVQHTGSSLNILNGKDEKYFDLLLNKLGGFQDKCTALALLKSYWVNSLNTYNRELLERIKKTWIKEKVNMKQLLIKKLKTDIALHIESTTSLVSPL
jgi:CHAD domain-containing protein